MGASERFDRYMNHLSEGLGHLDRHAGLKGYCTGLMLPLCRKSVEPMAARVDPMHASARHQALHHFVAKAAMVRSGDAASGLPMGRTADGLQRRGGWWIIDDTAFPKKGKHSVGVARQYCGMLGKQDNCQVAVSVSLACDQGSVPVAWQLYLPEDWAADPARQTWLACPRIALRHEDADRVGAVAHLAGRRRAAPLRAGRCRLRRGHRLPTGIERHGAGVRRGRDLGSRGLATRSRAAATKPYSGMGRPPVMPRRTGAASAGERQGAGPVVAGAGIPYDQLARRHE